MSESEFVIKLNEEVSVSGQLTAEMVEQVKALGFASVICNRPDGEGPDQPTAAEIEAAYRSFASRPAAGNSVGKGAAAEAAICRRRW